MGSTGSEYLGRCARLGMGDITVALFRADKFSESASADATHLGSSVSNVDSNSDFNVTLPILIRKSRPFHCARREWYSINLVWISYNSRAFSLCCQPWARVVLGGLQFICFLHRVFRYPFGNDQASFCYGGHGKGRRWAVFPKLGNKVCDGR